MADKRLNFAVRFNVNLPSVENIKVKTTLGKPVSYQLLSLPVYLAERLDSLISSVMKLS